MFLKTYFGSFHAKAHQNSTFFCHVHEECPKCNLLWKFGLDILLDGVLVTIFILHSFSCFNDLKLGSTITMAPRMVTFDLVFYKLSEKVTFVDFQQGEGKQGFDFSIGITSPKPDTMYHLKMLTMVSMETKVVSRNSYFDKLSEKFYLMGPGKGNRVFAGGHNPPPSLVFGAQKNPG